MPELVAVDGALSWRLSFGFFSRYYMEIIYRGMQVEQNSRKVMDEDFRKLAFAVIFLSLFVFALFGFAP